MECRNCVLWEKARTNCMPLAGSFESQILLVGEAPGENEDKEGIPFIGKSGRLLRRALEVGRVDNFSLTNICRCRPPKNRPPTQEEADACLPHLLEDLKKMPNLKLVVAIGNIALRTLTGRQSITKVSGEEWNGEIGGVKYKVMPLMHPSYILQNQDKELDRFFSHVSRIPRIANSTLIMEDDFGEYIIIRDMPSWKELLIKLSHCKEFSYDVETTGLNPRDEGSRIKCIQFSIDLRKAYVLPMDFWTPEELKMIIEDLKLVSEAKRIGKVGQNIKFDNLWMRAILGIEVKGTTWDTKIAEYLLKGKAATGLKDMAWVYSSMGGYEKRLSNGPEKIEGPDLESLYRYGAVDADLTLRIKHQQFPIIKKQEGIYHLFKTLLIPVSDVLMGMEYKGIGIDIDKVKDANKNCEDLVEDLKRQMGSLPEVRAFEQSEDKVFNPNSHQQIAYILFKIGGLDVVKKTEKAQQPATDKEVLELYAPNSKLCKLLLEYGTYEQMRRTFLSELLENERHGRIHTQLWLTETATGRTSSKKPNLHNIPKGPNDVLKLRECFIADPGYVLAEFDMSQHEMRVMAEMAHDEVLKEELKGDIHRATAATALGIRPEDVTSAQRDRPGKTINFGLIYGLTEYGLRNQVGCSEEEARLMLFRFFEKYYMTKRFMEETSAFVKKYGYVEALSGRRRYFPSWEEFDERKLKEVINFPIQATASDILLYGAIGVDRLLRGRKSYLVLEVHDSLLLNIHKSEFGIIPDIREAMITYFREFMSFESELKVDVKIGETWGQMEDYK